jgi:hypothetical protein
VPALHNLYRNLYRKPPKHRKPRRISFAVTGAAAVTIVAVASGVAAAAPGDSARQVASTRPAKTAVDSYGLTQSTLQLAQVRAHVVKMDLRKRGAEARQLRPSVPPSVRPPDRRHSSSSPLRPLQRHPSRRPRPGR